MRVLTSQINCSKRFFVSIINSISPSLLTTCTEWIRVIKSKACRTPSCSSDEFELLISGFARWLFWARVIQPVWAKAAGGGRPRAPLLWGELHQCDVMLCTAMPACWWLISCWCYLVFTFIPVKDTDELPGLANGGAAVQRSAKLDPKPVQTNAQPKLPKNLVREAVLETHTLQLDARYSDQQFWVQVLMVKTKWAKPQSRQLQMCGFWQLWAGNIAFSHQLISLGVSRRRVNLG